MKIVFVYPAFSSLAIEYLSAVAKAKGCEVSMVFDPRLFDDSFVTVGPLARLFNMRKKVVREVLAEKPDLLAFSVVTSDVPWFRELAAMIRPHTDAPIIAGNIHITSVPENILELDCVDAVVRGEGEGAFADIIDSVMSTGGIDPAIENLGTLENGNARLNPIRPLIADLDTLPFPDKTLYEKTPMKPTDIYTIMASRGCPYKCTFCNNNLLKRIYGLKGYVRLRSVDNVIEELAAAKKKYGEPHINFYDEVFGFNKKWLEEFVEKYNRRVGLPYIACTNPNIVTEEYADLLAESGCGKVDIGVQTINQEKRRNIYNRRETTDRIRRSIEILKSRNIFVAAENITNFPTENEDDLLEMAEFYNEVRPDILKVFWLRYFPSTEIIQIAMDHGVLTAEDVARINSGDDLGSITIDSASPLLQRQFYLLFVLIMILPKRWIDKIIRRRWYRRFPTSVIPGIAYTAARLLMRKSPDAEIMMLQYAARYKHYLKKFFGLDA